MRREHTWSVEMPDLDASKLESIRTAVEGELAQSVRKEDKIRQHSLRPSSYYPRPETYNPTHYITVYVDSLQSRVDAIFEAYRAVLNKFRIESLTPMDGEEIRRHILLLETQLLEDTVTSCEKFFEQWGQDMPANHFHRGLELVKQSALGSIETLLAEYVLHPAAQSAQHAQDSDEQPAEDEDGDPLKDFNQSALAIVRRDLKGHEDELAKWLRDKRSEVTLAGQQGNSRIYVIILEHFESAIGTCTELVRNAFVRAAKAPGNRLSAEEIESFANQASRYAYVALMDIGMMLSGAMSRQPKWVMERWTDRANAAVEHTRETTRLDLLEFNSALPNPRSTGSAEVEPDTRHEDAGARRGETPRRDWVLEHYKSITAVVVAIVAGVVVFAITNYYNRQQKRADDQATERIALLKEVEPDVIRIRDVVTRTAAAVREGEPRVRLLALDDSLRQIQYSGEYTRSTTLARLRKAFGTKAAEAYVDFLREELRASLLLSAHIRTKDDLKAGTFVLKRAVLPDSIASASTRVLQSSLSLIKLLTDSVSQ